MATIKILVSTELDELSAKVTKFAVDLSAQLGSSELILLNVIIPAKVEAFAATGDISTHEELSINQFNDELMKKHRMLVDIEAMKFTTEKVNIKPLVRFKDSHTDLNRIIESFDAGLLVFGSRDEHSYLSQIFNGDSDEKTRKVDYPTIVLKEDTRIKNINKIVVPLDVDEEDQSGLLKIAAFALALQARMNLLYVDVNGETTPDAAIEKMHNIAIEYKLSNYAISVVSSHKLEEGIKAFVRKTNPDMIAVLSQGKGKIKKFIFGNTMQDVIKEVDLPVFITKIN